MRSVRIHRPGDRRVLKLESGPGPNDGSSPAPGPDEIHVAVEAAGVNFADIAVRLGLYASAKKYVGWPIVPGFEVAGRVAAVGPGAAGGFAVGDPVIAVTRFGGYCTDVVVPSRQVLRRPAGVDAAAGAGFPVVFLTAWYGLVHLANARPGETVLVHSAAGGVGQALVQLAVARGCRIVGTVGGAEKIPAVLALGAVECVARSDHHDAGWGALSAAAPGGYDVILDALGADSLRQGYRRLAPGGRLVVYGHAEMLSRGGSGGVPWPRLVWQWLRTPRFDPLALTTENRSVLGFNLSFLFDRADVLAPALSGLLAGVERGELRPLPVTEFALADVASAHAALESGRTVGKLVLRM